MYLKENCFSAVKDICIYELSLPALASGFGKGLNVSFCLQMHGNSYERMLAIMKYGRNAVLDVRNFNHFSLRAFDICSRPFFCVFPFTDS